MKRLSKLLMLTSLLLGSSIMLILPTATAQAAVSRPARPYSTLWGTTWHGVSAASCEGANYYAYTGTDGHLNVVIDDNSSEGTTYTDTSQNAPSITCWRDKLWIAWEANDNSQAIHIADVTDAQSGQLVNQSILPNQSTSGPPSIGVNNGTLFVAYKWTGNSGNMTVNESVTGTSWFNTTIIANNTTSTEPSLTSYGGKLIIAWGGTDFPAHVNFATYSDGNPNLSNKVTVNDTTYGEVDTPIGISTYNNRIQLAFDQSGDGEWIYTGSWSSSTGYARNGQLAGSQGAFYSTGLIGLDVYYAYSTSNPYMLDELQMPG